MTFDAHSPGRGGTGAGARRFPDWYQRHVSPLPGLGTIAERCQPGVDTPGYYLPPSGLRSGQLAHVDLARDGAGDQSGPAFVQQFDAALGFGSEFMTPVGFSINENDQYTTSHYSPARRAICNSQGRQPLDA